MTTLSLVFPVFNEEKRLPKTFKTLERGWSFAGLKLDRVIFVNDGSTDRTAELIQKEKPKLEKALKTKVSLISSQPNRGKGYAIRRGMLASNSDYTLFLDADMSTPLSELKKFLPYFKSGSPIIIGTRKNGESTVKVAQPLYRQLLGRGFTLLSQIILNTWVSDFTCGFKAFSREAKNLIFPQTKVDRWSFDSEIIYLAKKFRLPIQEQAVFWYNDEETRVNLFLDLPRSLFDLISIRLANRQTQPFTINKIHLALD